MKRFLIKFLLPIVILFVGAAVFNLLRMTKPKALPVEQVEKVWVVDVETVNQRSASPELSLYGRVETPRIPKLRSALTAEVLSVPAREGKRAAKGELLVALDPRDAKLLLEQREAELASARADIDSERKRHENDLDSLKNEKTLLDLTRRSVTRMERLQSSQVASESLLEEARQNYERQSISVRSRELAIRDHETRMARLQARLRQAQAQRDLAALDLDRTRITAPFDGKVAKVQIAAGDRVRPGDPLVELYDDQALEVRAQIPHRYQDQVASYLNEGKPLMAQAGGARLVLDRLASMVSAGRGGVDGLFRVEHGAERLRVGSFLNLTLTLPPENQVILVPYSAIYGTDRVYEMVDGRMRLARLERVGEATDSDGRTRVLARSEELVDVDRLIVSQLPNAIEGLRVKTADDIAP